MGTGDALRTIAAFRLALPRTILRYAGGRELTLATSAPATACSAASTPSWSATTSRRWGANRGRTFALLDELEMPFKALDETF